MTREEVSFYNVLLPFVARKSYENGEHDAIYRVLEIIDGRKKSIDTKIYGGLALLEALELEINALKGTETVTYTSHGTNNEVVEWTETVNNNDI